MTNIGFIAECTKIVEGMRNRTILTPDGDFYKETSITNTENKIKRFQEYQEKLGGQINLSEIDFDWCEKYRLFLLEKGYAKNTISEILSKLKAFIKRFFNAGLTSFNGSGIRTSTEITTAVFNTVDELRHLLVLDLTEGKARVRDIYVIQCFIGLRVTDMMKFIRQTDICFKKIDKKDFIELKTNKTGEVVVIPIAKLAVKILEKRKYDLGKPFSEQYYRRELKEMYSKSGMDKDILFYRTEGGQKIDRVVRFSSLMGTHTARRTFATNAYLAGLNPLDIMKITGHKTFNSFIRYIRCENIAVALRISGHEFFNLE